MSKQTQETVEWLKIAAYIVIAIAIYKILKNFFGLFGAPENVTQTSDWSNVIVNNENLTYDESFYLANADAIEEAAFGGITGELTEDDQAMFDAMSKLMNNADVKQQFKAYGVRGRGIIIRNYLNLPQLISGSLDNDLKQELNELYTSRGITFQF